MREQSETAGCAEVFRDQPADIANFIGATAIRDTVFYQRALAESLDIRNRVYESLNWRTPGSPETDAYDEHSIQLSAINGRNISPEVAMTMRLVLHDGTESSDDPDHHDDIGLPLEHDFPDLELADRRIEVSRLASRIALKLASLNESMSIFESFTVSSMLYAKACQFGVEGNYQPYAMIEAPLKNFLQKTGVSMEVISDTIVIPKYDNTANFVVSIDPKKTRDNILNKLESRTGKIDIRNSHFVSFNKEKR
ncbi:hypothetical protein FACS1894219_09730 [Clostridia bacterium]|nr:hypothetical protein FACS1894219_09730 [Clostridia bacterium]